MYNRNSKSQNNKIPCIYFRNKMITNQEFYVEQSMLQIYIFGIPKQNSFSLHRMELLQKLTQQTVFQRREGKYRRGKSNVCKYEMTADFREQCFSHMQGSSIQATISNTYKYEYHQIYSAGYVYIHICMCIYASMHICVCTFYACIFVCIHTCKYKDIKKKS